MRLLSQSEIDAVLNFMFIRRFPGQNVIQQGPQLVIESPGPGGEGWSYTSVPIPEHFFHHAVAPVDAVARPTPVAQPPAVFAQPPAVFAPPPTAKPPITTVPDPVTSPVPPVRFSPQTPTGTTNPYAPPQDLIGGVTGSPFPVDTVPEQLAESSPLPLGLIALAAVALLS